MRVQLDDAQQLSFPGGADGSLSSGSGSSGNCIQSAREESFEDTDHRVLASQHESSDLDRGLTLCGEQEHLIAGARFGIGGLIVARAQVAQVLFVQWGERYGSSHLFLPFFNLPFFSLSLYHFSAYFTWKHLAAATACSIYLLIQPIAPTYPPVASLTGILSTKSHVIGSAKR